MLIYRSSSELGDFGMYLLGVFAGGAEPPQLQKKDGTGFSLVPLH